MATNTISTVNLSMFDFVPFNILGSFFKIGAEILPEFFPDFFLVEFSGFLCNIFRLDFLIEQVN